MEVSGQLHDHAALPPEKEPPVTIGYEAGRAPASVRILLGRGKSCTAGNRIRALQPLARRYTDFCPNSKMKVYRKLNYRLLVALGHAVA
jgi:hypothetical protein